MNTEKMSCKDLVFRIRFNVPDTDGLRDIDPNAYDFHFNQVKFDVLRNQLPKHIYKQSENKIFGLIVQNMYRAIIEDGLKKEDFVPATMLKNHPFFVKKPVEKELNMIIRTYSNYSAYDVKRSYLDQFKQILSNYLCESFKACRTNYVDEPSAVLIVVDPYHSLHPRIRIKYDLRRKPRTCMFNR